VADSLVLLAAWSLTIGSSDRGSRLHSAKEGVDDWDKAASVCVGATPRRSILSLAGIFMRSGSFSDIMRTAGKLKVNIADTAKPLWRKGLISAVAVVLFCLYGCGGAFEDNGTHLAYALEKGTSELRASDASELVVHYETLDSSKEPYYVEITPSLAAGQASNIWGSYLVVSGKTSGGTSYHNRFVFVAQRFYVKKDLGGPTEVVLHKDRDHVSVVELR
jgi:hypothetical protein